ncbi:Conserved hypothetical protein [gamma proteobacterium HdN1]|nr:Conserved hypothetical protein [gamma proteobacterium HdN1]
MKNEPLALLGGLTPEQFLSEYWQKKPLLVRNAVPEACELITPDELAGLSLEDDVESRIVLEHGENQWELRHGPFDEDTFTSLPETNWSLLVQAVDHYVPACSHLLDQFSFIPNWRIDDLMISYAPDKGSVGPHHDYYDVFLIQGLGQREWRIGQHCDETTRLLKGLPLKILESFEQTEGFVLNAGDMLYLPPALAHWGIAIEESMTLSVGFRAPSHLDLLQGYVDSIQEQLTDNLRFDDPALTLHENPGQLTDHEINQVYQLLQKLVQNPAQVRHWLGKALSESKYEKERLVPDESYLVQEVMALLQEGYPFQRDETVRILFTEQDGKIDGFFANGEAIELHEKMQPIALYLSAHRSYDNLTLIRLCQSALALQLLTDLLNKGIVYIAAEDDGQKDDGEDE